MRGRDSVNSCTAVRRARGGGQMLKTRAKLLTLRRPGHILDAHPSSRTLMTMMRATCLVLVFCLGGISWKVQAQSGRSREWLTWGGDAERTGWNRGETALSKQTVGRLALKWKTQIDKEVSIEIESGNSMLTAPLVAQGVRTPQGPKTVVYTLVRVEHARGARRRDRRNDLAARRSTTRSSLAAPRTGSAPTRRRRRPSSTRARTSSICWRRMDGCTASTSPLAKQGWSRRRSS